MSAVDLHVQRLGDGPALVITHGLFGSGTNWRTLARQLAPDWEVWLVDARNHGKSPHTATMSYGEMAEDLLRVMDRDNIERAHALGHSMGGKSVMSLALAHPERVASLAVADIAPVAYNHRFGVELEAMQALDLTQVRRRSDAATQMSAYLSDPALAAFLLQNLNVGANGASWRINLAAITQNEASLVGFPEQTSAYGGVTSFICGAQSDYVQTAHRSIIEQLFPAATIATVDDAGHWLHAERPEDFIAEFRAHLARASH